MEIYLSPWILLLLPSLIIFINIAWGTLRNCKQRRKVWSCFLEWKQKTQSSLHQWDSCNRIVCNTDSPIHIQKFIPQEVWKVFNVGINGWNITAVLYSNEDRTRWLSSFSWRLFLIHLKVYEMSQAYYCCLFNWKNSITCTNCNVILLGGT